MILIRDLHALRCEDPSTSPTLSSKFNVVLAHLHDEIDYTLIFIQAPPWLRYLRIRESVTEVVGHVGRAYWTPILAKPCQRVQRLSSPTLDRPIAPLNTHAVPLPLPAIPSIFMSLAKPTERSPLIGQLVNVGNIPAHGRSPDHGERGASQPLSSRDEQPSNTRLALIMGSIWVSEAEFAQP